MDFIWHRLIVSIITVSVVRCHYCGNSTLEPIQLQICNFGAQHEKPIGVLTTTAGKPVDLRDTITLNSDLFKNEYLLDSMLHFNAERVPERVVHAKGTAAIGYFLVTHNISEYTEADVFNGIGKKTRVIVRMSTAAQKSGGPDISKELKGMTVKFYTNEGNLDLLCIQTPVYLYRDLLYFQSLVHSFNRNPVTNVFDTTTQWDFVINNPTALNTFFWIQSDYGIPISYRNMDAFPIHTYEINNKNGDIHYVRFNFRTAQGIKAFTPEQLLEASRDIDYYTRDLYNAIANKNYPTWSLEMDVLTPHDIERLDYNPFDVLRLWKNGTYKTVQIGKLVLNKNPDNIFKVSELGAFNPASLVRGIPGPVDLLFKGRQLFYRDTQNYRLGRNHMKIDVNMPIYSKTYIRDGTPPVRYNMKDAPNYYPNSFKGPEPTVDVSRPHYHLKVIESNAVDLEPAASFYRDILTEPQRQRLVVTLVESLATTSEPVQGKALKLLALVDKDLIRRVRVALQLSANRLISS